MRNLVHFSEAVRKIAPHATGEPVVIQEAGKTVVEAFAEAGAWALLSISVLLFIVLGRVTDVLLTLIPLALAALVTLEITALIGMPLNYANITALPLLRCWGRLQDLFHHGLARGRYKFAANEPHASRRFQRYDDSDRIWKSVVFTISGVIEHGENACSVSLVHLGRSCFVSACSHGTSPKDRTGGG